MSPSESELGSDEGEKEDDEIEVIEDCLSDVMRP